MTRRLAVIAVVGALLVLILSVLPAPRAIAVPAGTPATVPTPTARPVGPPTIGPDAREMLGPVGRSVRVPFGLSTADTRGRVAIPFSLIHSSGSAAAASPAVPATSGGFVALSPRRLLDTRAGLGAPRTQVGAGRAVTLQVAGSAGIPRTGTAAVVLNVTATAATGPGFITVYPSGRSRPIASNLNYVAGATVANLVVAQVGANGKIVLYNGSQASVQLVADVAGYYGAVDESSYLGPVDGGFLPVGPIRMLDTRIGEGAPRTAVAARATVPVRVLGRYGVPTTGISAVIVNLTVTGATRPGYVTAYADGQSAPTASNVSFAAQRTVATLAVVPVGANGRIRLRNGSPGTISLVVDVAGYIRTGVANAAGAYTPLAPTRVLDTRSGLGAPRTAVVGTGTLPVQITGRSGVPAIGVSAVALTLTVTDTTGTGYLTAFGGRAGRPLASNLNYTAGRTVSNMVVVPVGPDGRIQLFNGSPTASVQVVADVAGYFLTGARTSLTWSHTTSLERVHGHPLALSCSSATFCMVGDASGSTVQFDGRTWSEPVSVDPGHTFVAMSCTAATFCVGADLDGAVVVYDGRTWARPRTIDPVGLVGLSCVSTTFCMAVGLSGQVIRYDGNIWRGSDIDADGQLTAVSCVSTTFCQAVDLSGRAFRWNGVTWSAPVLTDPGQPADAFGVGMWAVSCASTTWCVAVEDTGRAVAYDGSWRTPTTVGGGAPMYQVSCTAPRFCAATDVDGGLLTTTDGASWTTSSTALTGVGAGSPAVSCVSPVICLAVDTDGNGSTWNGTAWSAPSLVELDNTPTSISCPTSTFCLAVDGGGQAFTYRGAGWSGPTMVDPGGRLASVSCVGPTFCAAVDLAGRAILFDGRGWSTPVPTLAMTGGDAMVSVSCTSRTHCAAATSLGRTVDWNGTGWTEAVTLGRNTAIASISCTGNLCLAVGFDGYAYRFRGAVRSPAVLVDQGPLPAVSCASATFCATVGLFGDVLTYDGSRWTPPRVIDELSSGLAGVSCVSSTFCTAVDLTGQASNFDGAAWSPPAAIPGAASATSVSCASRSFCALVDSNGGVAIGRG